VRAGRSSRAGRALQGGARDLQVEAGGFRDRAPAQRPHVLRIEAAESARELEGHDAAAVRRPPIFEDVELEHVAVRRLGDEIDERFRALRPDAGLCAVRIALRRESCERLRRLGRGALVVPEAVETDEPRPALERLLGRHELDDRGLLVHLLVLAHIGLAAESERRLRRGRCRRRKEREERKGDLEHGRGASSRDRFRGREPSPFRPAMFPSIVVRRKELLRRRSGATPERSREALLAPSTLCFYLVGRGG